MILNCQYIEIEYPISLCQLNGDMIGNVNSFILEAASSMINQPPVMQKWNYELTVLRIHCIAMAKKFLIKR